MSLTASLPWPDEGQAAVLVEGFGPRAAPSAHGPRRLVPITSVTKVMTAYLVLRDHPLRGDASGPLVTVDEQAAYESFSGAESTVGARQGQRLSQRRLLELMLVPSGNNIARLLACWDVGSQEALKLARQVMRDDVFRSVVSLPRIAAVAGSGTISNSNELLNTPGLTGIKTGSSTPAGNALMWAVDVADRSGRRHLAPGVVLHQSAGISPQQGLRTVFDAGRALVEGSGSRCPRPIPPQHSGIPSETR